MLAKAHCTLKVAIVLDQNKGVTISANDAFDVAQKVVEKLPKAAIK